MKTQLRSHFAQLAMPALTISPAAFRRKAAPIIATDLLASLINFEKIGANGRK